jgi:hypothetical protein
MKSRSLRYLGVIALLTIVAAQISPTLADINSVENQNKQDKISNRPVRRTNNPAPNVEEDLQESGATNTPQPAPRSFTTTKTVNTPNEPVKNQPAQRTSGKTYSLVGIEVYRQGQSLLAALNQPKSEFVGGDVRSFEISYDQVDEDARDCPGRRYADHVKGLLDVEFPSTVTIGQPVTIKVTMRAEWSRDCVPPGYDTSAYLYAQAFDPSVEREWKDDKAFRAGPNQASVTSTITYKDRLFPIPYGDGVTVPKYKEVVLLNGYGKIWPGKKALEITVNFIYQ